MGTFVLFRKRPYNRFKSNKVGHGNTSCCWPKTKWLSLTVYKCLLLAIRLVSSNLWQAIDLFNLELIFEDLSIYFI